MKYINPIVYVDGKLADDLGREFMQRIADEIASRVGQPVDVMTHGASKYHSFTRIVGRPKATVYELEEVSV